MDGGYDEGLDSCDDERDVAVVGVNSGEKFVSGLWRNGVDAGRSGGAPLSLALVKSATVASAQCDDPRWVSPESLTEGAISSLAEACSGLQRNLVI